MKPSAFAYEAPTSVREAVEMMSRHAGEAKFLAGGQSLLPLLGLRLAAPSALVDLNGVDELAHYRLTEDTLIVGALCRHREIELDRRVGERAPLITEAVREIGHVAIRNRGTVGGSLAHADPSAEWPVLAVLLDASFVVLGPDGVRTVLARDFFDGLLATSLAHGELLTEIHFPLPAKGSGAAFAELARRPGDFAMVSVASTVRLGADGRMTQARLAAGGAAPSAIRLHNAEAVLLGKKPTGTSFAEAAAAAAAEVEPPADLHGEPGYRRKLVGVMTRRALTRAVDRHEESR